MANDDKASRRKSTGLGRGLSALMGDEAPAPGGARSGAREVPIELLHPNRFQPRTMFDDAAIAELADSIRERGVLQPILVRPHATKSGEFEIIAGERRWRASQKARLHQVPIVERAFNDDQALEVALIENVQRENLSPSEEARGYERLAKEFGHNHEQIAEAVGKSRSHITNLMRLLDLPEDVLESLDDGKLSMGHARALVGAKNASKIAKQIVKEGLSVRDVEAIMRGEKAAARKGKPPPRKAADTLALEKRLTDILGLNVTLKTGKGEAGTISIRYEVIEQLDAIIDKLGS